MRVHLARALALGPKLLIAEHPSAPLPRDTVAAFGADLAKAAQSRGLALDRGHRRRCAREGDRRPAPRARACHRRAARSGPSEETIRLKAQCRSMKPALILFDIDGTLLLSGRAGLRAMTRAFEQTFGITDAFAGEHFGGRTDSYLVSKALQAAGMPDTPEQHHRFRENYIPLLAEEIQHPGTGPQGADAGRAGTARSARRSRSSAPGAADRQLSRSRRDQAAALRAVGLLRVGRVLG